jgi:hypothetical protein
MKINECFVCWTPNGPQWPEGMRGKVRLFPASAGEADLAAFPFKHGKCHPWAHDPRRETREVYALGVAILLIDRDNLDLATVHQLMLQIDEYQTGCAPELLEPRSQHEEL